MKYGNIWVHTPQIEKEAPSATSGQMERVKGIEPSYAAWEAAVLPLNYTRVYKNLHSNRRKLRNAGNNYNKTLLSKTAESKWYKPQPDYSRCYNFADLTGNAAKLLKNITSVSPVLLPINNSTHLMATTSGRCTHRQRLCAPVFTHHI